MKLFKKILGGLILAHLLPLLLVAIALIQNHSIMSAYLIGLVAEFALVIIAFLFVFATEVLLKDE